MCNVEHIRSKTFDSQIIMHSCTQKSDVSLAKQFQNHLSGEYRKHGVIDQAKYRKRAGKRKRTDRDYYVQDNAHVAHKCVKMYCDTNQFPELPFCGPHPKPHGAKGLSKHYHLRFYLKLGHGICTIHFIPCACVKLIILFISRGRLDLVITHWELAQYRRMRHRPIGR